MVVQCTARKITGLLVSLLELSTVRYVMCALLIYAMWLKRPQDVISPTTMTSAEAIKGLTNHQIAKVKECMGPLGESAWLEINNSIITDIAEASIFIGAILGLIVSGIYGGVYLAAWNGYFPTLLERALWRISSCIIAGMPGNFCAIFAST